MSYRLRCARWEMRTSSESSNVRHTRHALLPPHRRELTAFSCICGKCPVLLMALIIVNCRAEFHKHKTAEDKFVAGFFNAWNDYAQQLEFQSMSLDAKGFGSNLKVEDVEEMSPEQHEQLLKLREAAHEAGIGRV